MQNNLLTPAWCLQHAGLSLTFGLFLLLTAHNRSHVSLGSAGDQPGSVGQFAEPLDRGNICTQQRITNEQPCKGTLFREDLTHLVQTQEVCWLLQAPSQRSWRPSSATPRGHPGPGAEGSRGSAVPAAEQAGRVSWGCPWTPAHFTFTFRKTKENGSRVNPCCVLN